MEISIATVSSTPIANAICDPVKPLNNFDGAAYMGVWYEQQHVIN